MYRFLRYVPKNLLSRVVGHLVHLRLPRPVGRRLVRWFADSYQIDVSAANRPIEEYASIGDFFVRDLKEGLRPIEGSFVSPVDGTLRSYGPIANGRLLQIKGKSYTVARFLGDETVARRYDNGIYFNLYLSPQDYHHVHAPVGGQIAGSIHIPGRLWPVNDWSLANIDELFAINERVVTWIDSDLGRVAVVMIGATNVGSMSVTYDSFVTNIMGTDRTSVASYDPAVPIDVGARLGTFHMGSSVVVLVEHGRIDLTRVRLEAGRKVRYGQAII